MNPTLWIIGTPLNEQGRLLPEAIDVIAAADVIIAESRRVALPHFKRAGIPVPAALYFLDPPRPEVWKEIAQALTRLKTKGGSAALLSDTGMPILFDPGFEVLRQCRNLGFTIRSQPSATSWGTAASLSGFPPPFYLAGFPPRGNTEREHFFRDLAVLDSASILMDTPYRYLQLIREACRSFGRSRPAFLAWEIAKPGEVLRWATLGELQGEGMSQGKPKGEFVLVIQGKRGS